jgi:predicted deacylase
MNNDEEPKRIRWLNIDDFPPGTTTGAWVHVINNGLGEPVRIPVIIARGAEDGPVFGLTAALHGNELNGIPVIQQLFAELDPNELSGSVVGVLVANVPAFIEERRKFNDGVDLNHIAPGKPAGDCSQLYMHRLIDRIVGRLDFLIDLHTASFGRVNSYYIRADMSCDASARMARILNPDIILDNPPNDYTLRGHASLNGIQSITLELKDPHRFQFSVVDECVAGIQNILIDLGLMPGVMQPYDDEQSTWVCDSSYWLYTDEGGFLTVLPSLGDHISEGDNIAIVRTVFGEVTKMIHAPEPGIVIGKSVNPVNQSGSRILHLGRNPMRKKFPKR